MATVPLERLDTYVTRFGVALDPLPGEPTEREGVLNPASTRTRDGKLLLYPRCAAEGNISRIGLCEGKLNSLGSPVFERLGFALEPQEPYELRAPRGGYGCEDARVTFVPLLDAYIMCYTAFGPIGPRIAFALSPDGYEWTRLGLADFSAPGLPHGDDKDAVFFPEPVISPAGVPSFAFYHRPMLKISAANGLAAIPIILDRPPALREATRIAYVPLEAALHDRSQLLVVSESVLVLAPGPEWGRIKNGAGTPPVRIAEGWMSFYHGVDAHYDVAGNAAGLRYCAGMIVHDAERPDRVLYHSPAPTFAPETPDELRGVVNNVVFPTAIDIPPGLPERSFEVYYGMADSRIGRARIDVSPAGPPL